MLTAVDVILSRSRALFSDVQDEFCDVKKILSRFEEWRGSYSDSYHSAYISLCLPKLLNPIIRHQLLAWNPLKVPGEWLIPRCKFTYHLTPCYQHDVCAFQDTIGDLESLPWLTAVEIFCHGHGHEELDHTDRQMLCTTIEKTVLPKMTGIFLLVWHGPTTKL